jgi:RNA polymerase sigma-70 factor (ECF subfamily)
MVTQQSPIVSSMPLEHFSNDDYSDDDEGFAEPSSQDVESEAHETVRGCLSLLDGKYRQVLTLAFNHGMSHAEIADHIGVPLGTVKTWARRGLAELKSAYESAQSRPKGRMGTGAAATV